MNQKRNYKTILIILATILIGFAFRIYHIEFGLPHSFHADEPEIAELAIKYTYEFRDIISQKNYYKLIPISFVYGTFPTYMLTAATMLFSKTNNVLNIPFDKTTVYIFLRTLVSLSTLLMIPAGALLAQKFLKNKLTAYITAFLIALNWKLIVHAHYVNADIILTTLVLLAFFTFYLYYQKDQDTLYTTLTGILFGLAVGTKITALISLPLFLYVFIIKKSYREMFAFIFIIFGTFAITNPFSFLFANSFAFRIYEMFSKEAGMVFDSVDHNPLKYLNASVLMTTLPVFVFSLYGIFQRFKRKDTAESDNTDKTFDKFLLGNILLYLFFYSIQSRRVDRWLLPILPIILIYAAYGIAIIKQKISKTWFYLLAFLALASYVMFPALLLFQFQKHTPKSEAYLWMKENVPPQSSKLIYTEEGLDPMNKLLGERVIQYEVYTSENAQFFVPEKPDGWEYIVLSSRPMQNFKKPEVAAKYPFYVDKWNNFEQQVLDPNNFELIKEFTLPKPNLVDLSDVYIYKNLKLVEKP